MKGQDGNVGDKSRGPIHKPSVRIPNKSIGKMVVSGDANDNMNGTRGTAKPRHGAFAK